jgi:outer membrane protein assembly factor BamB
MNRSLTLLVLGFLSIATASARGQEWTRFRGPNGSGLADATSLPVQWTEKDYTWKAKLPGVGHSSPVLWGERLFVTCAEESGKRFLLCLRTSDGEALWTREFPGQKSGKHQDNSFASSTPVVDDRHVYVCWGSGKDFLVVALDHQGKEVWRVGLGSFRAGHGFGPSPIVHDGLVVVPNDQDGAGSLIGLEHDTGKMRWKVPRKSKATYTTPCVYQPKGRPAELIFSNYEHGITSIDPKTGEKNWEIEVFDKRHMETGIGSPIVAGDLILGTCGWLGVRQEVVAVRPPVPGGDSKAKVVYTLDRSAPLCTTPLARGELLFLWSDSGFVTCANLATGEVHWRERVPGSYYSSPVCAGKYLYNVSRDGDVIVLAAANKFERVARTALGEESHATPAIADGRIYFRTFTHIIAIGGKKP